MGKVTGEKKKRGEPRGEIGKGEREVGKKIDESWWLRGEEIM